MDCIDWMTLKDGERKAAVLNHEFSDDFVEGSSVEASFLYQSACDCWHNLLCLCHRPIRAISEVLSCSLKAFH